MYNMQIDNIEFKSFKSVSEVVHECMSRVYV